MKELKANWKKEYDEWKNSAVRREITRVSIRVLLLKFPSASNRQMIPGGAWIHDERIVEVGWKKFRLTHAFCP